MCCNEYNALVWWSGALHEFSTPWGNIKMSLHSQYIVHTYYVSHFHVDTICEIKLLSYMRLLNSNILHKEILQRKTQSMLSSFGSFNLKPDEIKIKLYTALKENFRSLINPIAVWLKLRWTYFPSCSYMLIRYGFFPWGGLGRSIALRHFSYLYSPNTKKCVKLLTKYILES